MTKTFTPNDVLRYLYRETNSAENKELEEAMSLHSDLLDQYVQLAGITGPGPEVSFGTYYSSYP